jgi:DNA-dependent RNA polymerase auxiliary subunit epsilon
MGGLFVKDSFYINQKIDNKARVVSYKPLRIDDKGSDTDYVEISEGNITAGGHVDSLYFNATSDKRAKENIQPATYNAIELIKELPVYTYNYKNKTETVTGILAQDLLEVQPEGLDLVSNINATGENGDYMSIKNDKLVFILMKAIQEQQEQIEKLQEELNKLKESQ